MTKDGVRGIIKSKIYDTHHIETRDEDEIIEIQYGTECIEEDIERDK